MEELPSVNRLEVIDHTKEAYEKTKGTGSIRGFGRVLTKWEDKPFHVMYDLQDGGKTLKIFLDDLEFIPKADTEGSDLQLNGPKAKTKVTSKASSKRSETVK